jgi:parallel beta-helix repeat protein
MASQVLSNVGWCDMEIVPENPTSSDVVVITLSGQWGSSCTPNDSSISVIGNDIYFDVIWDYPPGVVCLSVITPWKLTRSAGLLQPGTYTIYSRIVGYPGAPGYEQVGEFIVTAGSHVDTVYYVNTADGNNNNDGLSPETAFATIQKGVDTAKSGDTVIIAPGIYIGEGNSDIDFYCKAITVRSIDPNDSDIVSSTIIDCNGAGYGFNFHSNEGPNSILAGMTITNGYVGIHCSDYSSPTIKHCTIMNNCAGYFAVGIRCNNSSPTIINCTISENSANYGRGIEAGYHSNLTIIDCIIADNAGAEYGGGIYCENSSPTITNCTIRGNSAVYRGGGIYARSCSNLTMTNCIISDNTANSYCGGGFFSYGSSIVIANCTFSNNSAPNGNALAFDSWSSPHPSVVQLKSCILWDGGNEIWNDDGSTITVIYSDVRGGGASEGNINTDPLFADPDNDDYHLKSAAGRWNPNSQSWVTDAVTSPCIDAGNPGCPVGDEPVPNGNRINMGAYGGTATASKSPANWRSIADLTNDWAVDFNDLKVFVNYWLDTGQCIPSDLNRNQSVDFSDFAVFAENWLYDSLPILTDADIILELEYLETINTYPENLNINPNDYPIVLGRYSENWLVLIEKYFCSDVCPEYGRVLLIYEDITSEEECAEIGGVAVIDPAWGSYIGCAPDVE